MVAGFVFAFRYGAWLLAAGIFASALCVFIWMEVAWIRVGRRVPGATTHPSGRLMVRNQLSKWLGVSISAAVVVCGIWMLDEMVLRLYNWCVSASHVAYVFALSLVLLLLPLRRLAQWVFVGSSVGRGGERGSWWRILTSPFVLPVALGVPLLMGWNFISHAMFQGGVDVWAGMLWTAVAAVVIAMLGAYSGIDLVNRSSAHSLYATRGSRAYLGASNPFRHVTEVGADVTSPQLEDDISFERYRPGRAGGPVHIINVFANQSLDRSSGRRTRDQQGHNMAVGPVGISVGPVSHAMWVPRKGLGEPEAELTTVGECDLPDPFVPRQHSPNKNMCAVLQTKALRLSEWMALSGAAVTAGPYAETRLGTSLLYGLTNVRSGFWWDSGIEDGERQGQPFPSMPRKLVRLLWRRFRAPRLLVAELTGRFPGPWRRYWYLSDGGQADDLGVYELVRRRVPVIICSDATRDVDGGLAALANAMRRVRVDFGATIEFLSKSALDGLASTAMGRRPPQSTLDAIGTLDDLRREPNANSRKHAALARVRYEGANAHSILLYIKATITGDEPVEVLEYRRQHHRFPHQSVLNQFLDEAQWESYRELGLHCASPLFGSGVDWLADVLNALQGDRDASQPRV